MQTTVQTLRSNPTAELAWATSREIIRRVLSGYYQGVLRGRYEVDGASVQPPQDGGGLVLRFDKAHAGAGRLSRWASVSRMPCIDPTS